MNRREFLTILAGSTFLAAPPASAMLFHGGSGSTAAPTQVATITYRNLLASPSPNPTYIRAPCWFTRGQVPTGQIVTPYVSGSPLATWQADNRVFWDDGSLMGAVFSVLAPSISASSTLTITFMASSGSWNNTSSVTTSTVTSESDFKIAVTNLHTTQTFAANFGGTSASEFLQVGYTIGGGVVTGGVVQFNGNNNGNGTYTLSQGNATVNASVTISGTIVTVNSGGSGYAYEGVSNNGQFSAGFNAAVALVGSAGNFNGVRLQQYAKGPALDAWFAIMPLVDTGSTARAHTHAIFYVERWKTSGGTLGNYRALGHLGLASNDKISNWLNATFDLDWKNGTNVLRGTSNSSPGYTTCFVNQMSSVRTWDAGETNAFAAGRLDWTDPVSGALSANDAALKAIVQERTPTEWAQLESTGLMQPTLTSFNGNTVGSALTYGQGQGATGFSVSTPPSTQSAYNTNTLAGSELNYLPLCRPMAMVNCRTGEGNGGSGHNESIIADNIILYGLALKGGLTTAAHSWLLVARGGACSFAGGANATPLLDTTTFQIPNIVPAGQQTFGNMPDNSGVDLAMGTYNGTGSKGYTNQLLHQGSGGGSIAGSLSTYHLPRYTAHLYLVEGEEWMLRDMVWTAGNGLFDGSAGNNGVVNRTISLGATPYAGLFCVTSTSRSFAWLLATVAYATALSPTTWADASTNNEQAYLHYILSNNFSFLNTLVPFVGTVQTSGNAAVSKADWTGGGIFGMQQFITGSNAQSDTSDTLFLYYLAITLPVAAFLCRDITAIKTYLNYFILSHASKWAFSGSHYMFDAAYFMELQNDTLGGSAITNWTTIDSAQAGWQQAGMTTYYTAIGPNETAGGCALNFVGSSGTNQVVVCEANGAPTVAITNGTYNSSNGEVVLTLQSQLSAVNYNNIVFRIFNLAGSGSFASLDGIWTGENVSGNSGTTLKFIGPTGLPTTTISSGSATRPDGVVTEMLYLWTPSTAALNGSAIMLTPNAVQIAGGSHQVDPSTGATVTAPTGLAFGAWYFLGNSTIVSGAQTFDLYDTQAHALAGGATGKMSWTGNNYNLGIWWAPYDPSGLPADTSGKGSFNGSNSTGGAARCANDFAAIMLMNAYAFTAVGDSVPYPALDTAIGISNAIGAAVTNVTTMCTYVGGPGAPTVAGVTFKDEPLYAVASSL